MHIKFYVNSIDLNEITYILKEMFLYTKCRERNIYRSFILKYSRIPGDTAKEEFERYWQTSMQMSLFKTNIFMFSAAHSISFIQKLNFHFFSPFEIYIKKILVLDISSLSKLFCFSKSLTAKENFSFSSKFLCHTWLNAKLSIPLIFLWRLIWHQALIFKLNIFHMFIVSHGILIVTELLNKCIVKDASLNIFKIVTVL